MFKVHMGKPSVLKCHYVYTIAIMQSMLGYGGPGFKSPKVHLCIS